MPLYNATVVASPQPGTTNEPFAIGPIPAFTPVVTTITDDSAVAIAAQTVALTAELVFIDAAINQINNNIAKQLSQQEAFAKSLKDLEIAFLSIAAAKSQQNVILSSEAASTIQKNNFDTAVKNEKPELPSPKEQIEEGVKSATVLNSSTAILGSAQAFITQQSNILISIITETETYKTVKAWLTEKIDFIKASALSFYNKTVDAIKSNIKAIAGDKTI